MSEKGVDVGVVVEDADAALRFYRDTLGLDYEGEVAALNGRMHRLRSGSSVIKLVCPDVPPGMANPPGGFFTATGLRYFTLSVPDLAALLHRCREAGYTTAVEPTEARPGVLVAVVEDSEGNWVELLQIPGGRSAAATERLRHRPSAAPRHDQSTM